MAIVWSQTIEENHYEVRSAGATLRLYRGQCVFATQLQS